MASLPSAARGEPPYLVCPRCRLVQHDRVNPSSVERMLETKVLAFRINSTLMPDTTGDSMALDVNLYPPGTTEVIGEGWEPLSHQVSQLDGGDFLLTVLVRRDTTAPDHLPA